MVILSRQNGRVPSSASLNQRICRQRRVKKPNSSLGMLHKKSSNVLNWVLLLSNNLYPTLIHNPNSDYLCFSLIFSVFLGSFRMNENFRFFAFLIRIRNTDPDPSRIEMSCMGGVQVDCCGPSGEIRNEFCRQGDSWEHAILQLCMMPCPGGGRGGIGPLTQLFNMDSCVRHSCQVSPRFPSQFEKNIQQRTEKILQSDNCIFKGLRKKIL